MTCYSVFVHSTGTLPSLWSTVPAAILGDSKPWFPANLGYPPMPPVPRGTMLNADDDARHLLSTLPPDATSLRIYGHSYGGLVAMKLARLATIPVESLTLLEPVLFGALRQVLDRHPEVRGEVEYFNTSPVFLSDDHGGKAEWLELFIDYWNRPGSWARMPEALQQGQLALGWKMYQEVRSVNFDLTPFENWHFDLPLTIAWGEKTTVSAKAMCEELLAVNPHARAVHIPGANHMAILLKPDAVYTALLA